jgi:excisionase family DNA binding protein
MDYQDLAYEQAVAAQASLRVGPSSTARQLPKLVKISEAAEATSTAETTLRQWVRAGKLRAYSANRKDLRVRVEDVLALFAPVTYTKSEVR